MADSSTLLRHVPLVTEPEGSRESPIHGITRIFKKPATKEGSEIIKMQWKLAVRFTESGVNKV